MSGSLDSSVSSVNHPFDLLSGIKALIGRFVPSIEIRFLQECHRAV
jgi:hypothetical protein